MNSEKVMTPVNNNSINMECSRVKESEKYP